MAIKAIIVDDELLAREMLSQMITSLGLDLEIVCLCADLPEALKAINLHQPNLVFLDVDMPRFKGLEINQFLSEIRFDIIFTTAHQEFAIDAIKIGAFDYLLKPIDIEELDACLKKYIGSKPSPVLMDCDRLIVNTVQQIYLIDYKKIIYLKAEGAYTKIITTETEITASKNLKYYEDMLSNHKLFLRIHKSYIVNKAKIVTVHKLKQQAILENGDSISIAQDKIDRLLML